MVRASTTDTGKPAYRAAQRLSAARCTGRHGSFKRHFPAVGCARPVSRRRSGFPATAICSVALNPSSVGSTPSLPLERLPAVHSGCSSAWPDRVLWVELRQPPRWRAVVRAGLFPNDCSGGAPGRLFAAMCGPSRPTGTGNTDSWRTN